MKWIWNKNLFKPDFSDANNLCFVFTPGWYYPEYIKYLKRKYKSSKFVFYFSDTVDSKLKMIPSLDMKYLRENFDLVLSYNQQDVEKYDLKYTSIYYSKIPQSWVNSLPKFETVDVLFIGAARNRLDEIKQVYEKLTKAGLKSYFYVVEKDKNKYDTNIDGIHFSPTAMPFKEYLARTMSTKSILEILDTNTSGSTLRFWEAIMYNKKLITNYPYVKENNFYSSNYIHYFREVNEIDPSFLRGDTSVQYNYKGENSPVNFLKLIENYLAETKVK